MYPGKWGVEFPDKPAAVHAISFDAVTYGELNDRSNQLAQLMWEKGLRPGDHVAIFMENNLRFFEVVWAAFRSGLYLTTINRYLTSEEAGYILDNCEAQVLVASKYLGEVAETLCEFAPNCHIWLMTDGTVDDYQAYEETIANYAAVPLPDQPWQMPRLVLLASKLVWRYTSNLRRGLKCSADPQALQLSFFRCRRRHFTWCEIGRQEHLDHRLDREVMIPWLAALHELHQPVERQIVRREFPNVAQPTQNTLR